MAENRQFVRIFQDNARHSSRVDHERPSQSQVNHHHHHMNHHDHHPMNHHQHHPMNYQYQHSIHHQHGEHQHHDSHYHHYTPHDQAYDMHQETRINSHPSEHYPNFRQSRKRSYDVTNDKHDLDRKRVTGTFNASQVAQQQQHHLLTMDQREPQKRLKVDYQQASTCHQSPTSKKGNNFQQRRNIKETIIDALPYPAKGVEVVYTKDPDTAESWLQSNIIDSSVKQVGLDIEWKPQFVSIKNGGTENKTAVIQLSVEKSCLVLHIFRMKTLPALLTRVLSDKKVLKVGSGINGDVCKLLKDTGLLCDGRVDTQECARAVGINQCLGLKNLSNTVLGLQMDKPKSVSVSNWELFPLKVKQIQYAALDSWISLMLYLKLKQQLDQENEKRDSPKTVTIHYGEPPSGKKKAKSKLKQPIKNTLGKAHAEPGTSSQAKRETDQKRETEPRKDTKEHVLSKPSSTVTDKPFDCPIEECTRHLKQPFETEQELQDHIKSRHVSCKICGKLYKSKVSVKHKKRHAKERCKE